MSKNIQRVQEMLSDTYKRKVQVGYKRVEKERKIGERWFDADGKEWEQMNGYISSIRKLPSKGLGDQCSECKRIIIKPWDKEIYKFNNRCYYCQIDFEAELKGTKKFDEWLENQNKRIKEQYIEKFEEENKELVKEIEKMRKNNNPFDMKVANAMSNENVSMTIKKNMS